MFSGMIAFVAGAGLLQLAPELPHPAWALPSPLLLWLLYGFPRLRWLWLCGLGFAWALYSAHSILSRELAPGLEGRDLLVEGAIISLPERRGRQTRFQLDVDRLMDGEQLVPSPGPVRLSWYLGAPEIRAGERWRLLVRLKRPHGFFNGSGFDYEAWLFRQGIRATGYVRASAKNRRLDDGAGKFHIHGARQDLRSRIQEVLGDSPTLGLVLALAIGDRSVLSGAEWRALSLTGTNHLVAISGLHIGIVAGWTYFLVLRLWPVSERLALWCAAPRAAAAAALCAALVYAALAGFAIPTQRALIMLTVILGGVLLRRQSRPLHSLAVALTLVVALDPLSLLSIGFWLSFGAVGVILYALEGRLSTGGRSWQWGRIQWTVAIGLLPLLLWIWGRAAVGAPLVNLVAVPLFSLVIVPLVMLGTLLVQVPHLGAGLLKLGAWLLSWSMQALEAAADSSVLVSVSPQLPAWAWLWALVGVALLLAPRGLPARWLGLLCMMPLLLLRPQAPGPGEVWLTLLDVGQGLSAVIRTRGHTLVYDTGARFSPRFDAASAVLVPYLRAQGISRIERLVLSNADNDHAGAAQELLAWIPAADILSGEPRRLSLVDARAAPCEAGTEWSWDGVRFRMLHPGGDEHWTGNDASCVLAVDNGAARILLPGDIEARAEAFLVDNRGGQLRADILIVPHHGSATSSTPDFVSAVKPDFALVAAGYRNRYGFPRPGVMQRWRQAGARLIDTASAGAVRFRIHASGLIEGPHLARRDAGRYWTHRPVGVRLRANPHPIRKCSPASRLLQKSVEGSGADP